MSTVGLRRLVASFVVLVAVGALVSGCARGEFEDRSAVVTVGGASQTYDVESCGLDGQTAFVVARAADGAIVQAVMGLEDDDKTAVPASTGVTIDLDPASDDTRVAAFGAESWERRGRVDDPPGTITSAKLRGSRIQFSGDAEPVDADDAAVPRSETQPFSFDARCDELDA